MVRASGLTQVRQMLQEVMTASSSDSAGPWTPAASKILRMAVLLQWYQRVCRRRSVSMRTRGLSECNNCNARWMSYILQSVTSSIVSSVCAALGWNLRLTLCSMSGPRPVLPGMVSCRCPSASGCSSSGLTCASCSLTGGGGCAGGGRCGGGKVGLRGGGALAAAC
eukprot:6492310-Amphidinium_carterae.3